jgi:hypothetical protein
MDLDEYIDQPFLDVLPSFAKNLKKKKETGLAILWDFATKKYVTHFFEGDEITVQTPPALRKKALIVAHTHPPSLYPKAQYQPPSHLDIREFLVDQAYYGNDAPHDYVLDKSGVYRILGLTKEAQKEWNKQFFYNQESNAVQLTEKGEDFLDVAMHNANNNGVALMQGKLTMPEYIEEMAALWDGDMGINIVFIPYSRLL